MCHLRHCAVKNGHYKRSGYNAFYQFIEKILIQRYICRNHQRLGKLPLTFSLLPAGLRPYGIYSIKIMSYCLSAWLIHGRKLNKTVADIFTEIEDASERLVNIEPPQLSGFIKFFEGALRKYKIWKKIEQTYSLERFIEYCSRNKYEKAEQTGVDYYESNGGAIRNSQFLFGTASQFR